MERLVVCVGRATLIGVDPFQKLVVLRHKVVIGRVPLRTVTSSLLLLSDDVLVVLEQLAGLLFGGSLGSTV